MKVLAIQDLLKSSKIDFFRNDEWPGISPNLNGAEDIGSILKDEVELEMDKETGRNKYSMDKLKLITKKVLSRLAKRQDIFQNILHSYPCQIRVVLEAGGGNTSY